MKKMTLRDAIVKVLKDDLPNGAYNDKEIYDKIKEMNYIKFGGNTPVRSVNAQLGDFIRNDDLRVRRTGVVGKYRYYYGEYQNDISIESDESSNISADMDNKHYLEKDLYPLLVKFNKLSGNIYTKSIEHTKSKKKGDSIWSHPDLVGVSFATIKNSSAKSFMSNVDIKKSFNLYSYEMKKTISNDDELKKCYFQAVSNSSFANYGYLVAREYGNNLKEEMDRINNLFGIGFIELTDSKNRVIHEAKYKELDFKTIDKLCEANPEFEEFIQKIYKYIEIKEIALLESLERFCETPYDDENLEKYIKDKIGEQKE